MFLLAAMLVVLSYNTGVNMVDRGWSNSPRRISHVSVCNRDIAKLLSKTYVVIDEQRMGFQILF